MEKRIPVIIPAYEPDEKMIRLLQTLQRIDTKMVISGGSAAEKIFLSGQTFFDGSFHDMLILLFRRTESPEFRQKIQLR